MLKTRLLLTIALVCSTVPWNPSAKHKEADTLLSGPQRHTLLVGGSRSGKTTTLCKANVLRCISSDEYSRHLFLRQHAIDVKQAVGMDTMPKMLAMRFPDLSWSYHQTDMVFRINNKTVPKEQWPEIWLAGLDEKGRIERILGKESVTLTFNECSQIPYASVLIATTRLAQVVRRRDGLMMVQRALYDLNPVGTGHWSYKLFVEKRSPDGRAALVNPGEYQMIYMNPMDNAGNLSAKYLEELQNYPERLKKRFFDGKYLAQIDGALWTLEMIEQDRLSSDDPLIPPFKRIVIPVDPSGAAGPQSITSDAIGIGVIALGADDHLYVLEDLTGLYSPENWSRITCEAFWRWEADRVVGESNFGGDMVRAVVQGHIHPDTGQPVGGSVPYKAVTASRGKTQRAEPVAAMYERHLVHHVGRFEALEDEMTNFTASGYLGERSPNRADWVIWGATELFGTRLPHGLNQAMLGEHKAIEIANEQAVARAIANIPGVPLEVQMAANLNKLYRGLPLVDAANGDSGTANAETTGVNGDTEKHDKPGALNKLATTPAGEKNPTVGCPACGAICVAPVASGGLRCSNCGNQWGGRTYNTPESSRRANLFK